MLLESSNTCTSIICRPDPRMCCLTTRLLSRDKFFLNLRKLVSIPHFCIISYITLGDSRLLYSVPAFQAALFQFYNKQAACGARPPLSTVSVYNIEQH